LGRGRVRARVKAGGGLGVGLVGEREERVAMNGVRGE